MPKARRLNQNSRSRLYPLSRRTASASTTASATTTTTNTATTTTVTTQQAPPNPSPAVVDLTADVIDLTQSDDDDAVVITREESPGSFPYNDADLYSDDEDYLDEISSFDLPSARPQGNPWNSRSQEFASLVMQLMGGHSNEFHPPRSPPAVSVAPKKTKKTKALEEANKKANLSSDAPTGKGITCAVCLDNCTDMMATTCGHVFCNACICNSIANFKKCPICRTKLTMKKIHPLYL